MPRLLWLPLLCPLISFGHPGPHNEEPSSSAIHFLLDLSHAGLLVVGLFVCLGWVLRKRSASN